MVKRKFSNTVDHDPRAELEQLIIRRGRGLGVALAEVRP
jgi:hypothetical protein